MTVLEALQDARARIESATRTLLVRARDRIANPAHWTQSFSARDCSGNSVENPAHWTPFVIAVGSGRRLLVSYWGVEPGGVSDVWRQPGEWEIRHP